MASFSQFLESDSDFNLVLQLAQQNNYQPIFLRPDSVPLWLIGSYLTAGTSLEPDAAKVEELAANFENCIVRKEDAP